MFAAKALGPIKIKISGDIAISIIEITIIKISGDITISFGTFAFNSNLQLKSMFD